MNMYQQRHESRLRKIHDLFEDCYRHQIDDFHDARDQLLKDIDEVFLDKYGAKFKSIAIDDSGSAREILREVSNKL